MPHDVANTQDFAAVIDLCEQIDEFVMNHEDTEDVPAQQVLNAVGHVVGMVLHSINERKHHAVTIDARFGIDGFNDAPITVTHHSAPRPIRLELGRDMQPTSDHAIWNTLERLHDFISDEHEATPDHEARRLLDGILLTIGAIDVAIREDTATDTLVSAEAKEGLITVTARPIRME